MKSAVLALAGITRRSAAASPAQAGEIFGGLYVHDVDTPLTLERGRGRRRRPARLARRAASPRLRLQPYAVRRGQHGRARPIMRAVGSPASSATRSSSVRASASRSTPARRANFERPQQRQDRLRQPRPVRARAGVGTSINDRMTLEASWVHMSHGSAVRQAEPRHRQFRRAAVVQALGYRQRVDLRAAHPASA